ncbi:hypothetical protein GYMLUDRAFT_249888 [Collybiopsis luxurians FD-317 M1]|uniref:Chitin synthase export chaperone n=1 Tax=Collybiopsis luxurians FD-317 M1 TaxID=944289 RepID=A0A0D0BWF3_9AGAR|nr:hypothetical protein GYMLUDRAFT_249888 [Collybiopsis luxurians FD-317 M1]
MTPEDQEILADFGSLTFYNTITQIVTLVGYGLFVLATLIAAQIITTKSWTRSRITLFACLITIYVGFTWELLCGVVVDLVSTKYTLVEVIAGPGGFQVEVERSDARALPSQYMQSWAGTITLLLSDGLVVWRAWTLFQDSRLPKFALAFLMIANVGAIYCAIQATYVVLVIMDAYVVVTKAFHVIVSLTITAFSCYPAIMIILISRDTSPLIDTFQATEIVGPNEDLDSP